ncbi:hypothetical protein ABE073_18320 [Lederbergia citrisecunda]|uniref:hypothetical protein n=1 Tax=Lederbergia citrisecunda TaxID=2833583 RepID=UPI003D2D47C0
MKRFVSLAVVGILVIGIQSPAQASTVQQLKNEILTMQLGVSADELQKLIEELVFSTGMSENEIYEQMYKEMEEQNRLSDEEAEQLAEQFGETDEAAPQGGGSALYIVGLALAAISTIRRPPPPTSITVKSDYTIQAARL